MNKKKYLFLFLFLLTFIFLPPYITKGETEKAPVTVKTLDGSFEDSWMGKEINQTTINQYLPMPGYTFTDAYLTKENKRYKVTSYYAESSGGSIKYYIGLLGEKNVYLYSNEKPEVTFVYTKGLKKM